MTVLYQNLCYKEVCYKQAFSKEYKKKILISLPKRRFWVLKRTVSMRRFF